MRRRYNQRILWNYNLNEDENYTKSIKFINDKYLVDFYEQRKLMFAGKASMFSCSVDEKTSLRAKSLRKAIKKARGLINLTKNDIKLEIDNKNHAYYKVLIVKPALKHDDIFTIEYNYDDISKFNDRAKSIIYKMFDNNYIPAYGKDSYDEYIIDNNEKAITFIMAGNNKMIYLIQRLCDGKISISFDEQETYDKPKKCQAIKWIDEDDLINKLNKDYREYCNDWYEGIDYIVEDNILFL